MCEAINKPMNVSKRGTEHYHRSQAYSKRLDGHNKDLTNKLQPLKIKIYFGKFGRNLKCR